MNLTLIAPEVIQRFSGSLLHFIWQGAVLALVAAAGLRLLRDRSAETRYAFAIGSLLCMLAAPLLTLAFYAQTGAVTGRVLLALRLASTQGHSEPLQSSLWAQRILLAWCVGVIVFAARLIVGWRLSWRLVRSAEEILFPAVTAVFESVRQHLGIRRPIRLRAHDSAMTDANGRFTISDVVPGRYTLEAEQQGFFDVPGRQAVATVAGRAPTSITVPLLAGGTITGRVKNDTGRLLPNANVTAYQITYLNGKIIPEAQSSQTTDDRGEYRMFWLPPGDYVVLVYAARYSVAPSSPATGTVIQLNANVPRRHPLHQPELQRVC